MRLKILFLLFSIFSIGFCYSESTETDSLKKIVDNAANDSSRVEAMIVLGRSYFNINPDSGIKICNHAKQLAETSRYTKGIANALKASGIGYYRQGKYVDALQDWENSKKIYESIGDKKGVANMLSNLGVIYRDQADNEKALDLYIQSLKIAEEINDSVRIMTVDLNIGTIYGEKAITYEKAIEYYEKAMPYAIALDNKDAIGTITGNLGEIYLKSNKDSLALANLEKSLVAYEGTENVPYTLNLIGKLYAKRKNFEKAIDYQQRAFSISERYDAKLDMAKSMIGLADSYKEMKRYNEAISNYMLAESFAKQTGANNELKDTYEGLAMTYGALNDFGNAFKYQSMMIAIKDTLYNIDTEKKLGTMLFNYQIDKKQSEINLQQKEISKQKIVRNSFIGGFAIVMVFAGIFFMQRNRISKEKKRSDELLLNILPEETAEELKATGSAKTKSFDSVSVLFTDFKNFTQASEKLSPEELVAEINHCYSEFDKIVSKYGIEKIKTIGDAYMCAGGLPVKNNTHPFDIVNAGIEMQQFIESNKKERQANGLPFFELRLGVHTGPVVAGVVGTKKFAYDIWGDTVNTASRMESSGETGKVNISGATFQLIKDQFKCTHRGKVQAKNKGEIDMYFVESQHRRPNSPLA